MFAPGVYITKIKTYFLDDGDPSSVGPLDCRPYYPICKSGFKYIHSSIIQSIVNPSTSLSISSFTYLSIQPSIYPSTWAFCNICGITRFTYLCVSIDIYMPTYNHDFQSQKLRQLYIFVYICSCLDGVVHDGFVLSINIYMYIINKRRL